MRRVSWLWLLICWGVACAQQAPILLVYQERIPVQDPNKEAPNLPIQPSLNQFFGEIRKVRLLWYQPDHPTVQQLLAQRGIDPKKAETPDPNLLIQVARALNATYLLKIRCENSKRGQIAYACTLWQVGRRHPIWQSEGIQQYTEESYANALPSLLRTLVMRMNQEVFDTLPTLPETPPVQTPPSSGNPITPSDDPQKQVEQLLQEGRLREAIAPLRTLITRDPMNRNYRMQIIQIYRQLGMTELAFQAVEDTLRLSREDEALLALWADLLIAQRSRSEAIPALKQAVSAHPQSNALRLRLFDLLLLAGQVAEAEAVLKSVSEQNGLPETLWRDYLLEGAKRQYRITSEPVHAFGEQREVWWTIVSGAFTDFANEILDLRRLASDPAPNWQQLRQRGEQLVQQVLAFGQWVGRMQPDDTLQKPYQHLRFGVQLLGQSAQHMARYLLSKNIEEAERSAMLRIEALRELESAQPK